MRVCVLVPDWPLAVNLFIKLHSSWWAQIKANNLWFTAFIAHFSDVRGWVREWLFISCRIKQTNKNLRVLEDTENRLITNKHHRREGKMIRQYQRTGTLIYFSVHVHAWPCTIPLYALGVNMFIYHSLVSSMHKIWPVNQTWQESTDCLSPADMSHSISLIWFCLSAEVWMQVYRNKAVVP